MPKPKLPEGMFKAETVPFKDRIIGALQDIAQSLKAQKSSVVNVEAQKESPNKWELEKISNKKWILTARRN